MTSIPSSPTPVGLLKGKTVVVTAAAGTAAAPSRQPVLAALAAQVGQHDRHARRQRRLCVVGRWSLVVLTNRTNTK